MTALHRVLLDGSDLERDGDTSMRFRLTYTGPLKPTQDRSMPKDPNKTSERAEHKHNIRREFHLQLKRLWQSEKFLREWTVEPAVARPQAYPSSVAVMGSLLNHPPAAQAPPQGRVPLKEHLASQYAEYGYHFVPLVREDAHLSCALRILFLRRDPPGGIYNLGDIDNRLKTVLDSLRRPRSPSEVPRPPLADENPLYVLLEDDRLVTHLEVETDTLHLPPTGKPDDAALAQVIISVDVRPHHVTMDNLSYV